MGAMAMCWPSRAARRARGDSDRPAGQAALDRAGTACSKFRSGGGTITDFDGMLPEADVWVDALFGLALIARRRVRRRR